MRVVLALLSISFPGGVSFSGVTPRSRATRHGFNQLSAVSAWTDLGVAPWLAARVDELGFVEPSAVQQVALPFLSSHKDAVLQAQTGSGKTLAYLLPLLSRIDRSRHATQVVILVPTRELGLQVSAVAKKLTAGQTDESGNRVLVMSLLEGSRNRRQRAWAWAEPPQVIVSQPTTFDKVCGRAFGTVVRVVHMIAPPYFCLPVINPLQMLARGGLRCSEVVAVVVDEVDACCDLTSPTGSALYTILSKHLSPSYEESSLVEAGAAKERPDQLESTARIGFRGQRQTIFTSASIPQSRHFIKQCVQRRWFLHDEPEFIHVEDAGNAFLCSPPSQISHTFYRTPKEKKLGSLRAFLRREASSGRLERAVVFVRGTRPLDQIAVVLREDLRPFFGAHADGSSGSVGGGSREDDGTDLGSDGGVYDDDELVGILHEDLGLNGRAGVVDAFRSGAVRVLLSTDLAARGIDVPETTHVVQFDMPLTSDQYLHRAGRTGRMGRPGAVLTLGQESELFVIERIANSLSIQINVK